MTGGLFLGKLPLRAQVSPGELSNAHETLDSPLKCSSCHAFGAGSVQFRCLDCHEEIKSLLAQKRGYHARVVKGTVQTASNDCARCHPEHNGRQAQLIRWKTPKDKFDHREAGYILAGKHAQANCAQCHTPKNIAADERALVKRKDLTKAYVGLNPRCSTCHQDEHRGALGQDCARCHSMDSWKDAPGFAHDKTAYPLTGLHQKVSCDKCHKRIAAVGNQIQYKNFVFYESCKSCHKDPHGGSFQGDCQKCHTTSGWKPAKTGETFDHSKTDYPLIGKHEQVACKKCHKTENFRTPVPHAQCLNCHQDQHQGQFARLQGGECSQCHTEVGWKPSTFTVSRHAKSPYPLKGQHAAVPCDKCHSGVGVKTNYHPASASCRDCHQDRHRGQFAAAPYNNRCETCHVETAWVTVRFTVAAHQQTRFPLNGAHAAVPCTSCHPRAGKPEELQFHPANFNCAACHADPHQPVGAAAAPARWTCESCHSAKSWRATGPFDHNQTSFPLTGKHRGAGCTDCHKPAVLGQKRLLVFKGTTTQCGACHDDIHEGQFTTGAAAQPDCARCHTAANWLPTEFDHQKHSTFSTAGAHERVPCKMCHADRHQVSERIVIVYRGTPRACEACHK